MRKDIYSRELQKWQRGTCALHAGYLRLQIYIYMYVYIYIYISVFIYSSHYSCQILIKLDFWQIYQKSSNFKFIENQSSSSPVVACGRTDIRLIVTFRNLASTPKHLIMHSTDRSPFTSPFSTLSLPKPPQHISCCLPNRSHLQCRPHSVRCRYELHCTSCLSGCWNDANKTVRSSFLQ
jgi:hypothetical protein